MKKILPLLALVLAAISYQALATPYRSMTFINQCPFPVWFGFTSGSAGKCNAGQCPAGSTCNKSNGICYLNNPTPDNYKLGAKGGTKSVKFYYQAGKQLVWSGIIAGRTGCKNGKCVTADCGKGPNGACKPFQGFTPPFTGAEFTMYSSGIDTYDVEVINGFNIPLEIKPNVKQQDNNNPYFCGSPGSPTPANSQLGKCSWNFKPPSDNYNWVTPDGKSCNSSDQCSKGEMCGLSLNPTHNPLVIKSCGKFLGYWTANQVCGTNNGQDGDPYFNCQQVVMGGKANLREVYGCMTKGKVLNSCYQNGATSQCCGCANWSQFGIKVPNSTTQCKNTNSAWTTYAQPTVQWLKKACPTAYTYPFDDPSSTFTCSSKGKTNIVKYAITFCPDGKTGKPK